MTFLLWAWRLEKLLLNVYSQNHYFQLKRLWLFLFAVFLLAANRPIFLTSICHYDMRLARVNHHLLLIYIYIYIQFTDLLIEHFGFGQLRYALGKVRILNICNVFINPWTLWMLFVRHLTSFYSHLRAFCYLWLKRRSIRWSKVTNRWWH